jgi:hypothetical protein
MYVAGNGEHAQLRERLEQILDIPVRTLDPLTREDGGVVPAGTGHGGFAGAVGLVHLWSVKQGLPINLIRPKEPRPDRNPKKRLMVIGAAAAAVLIVVGIVVAMRAIADKKDQIRQLTAQKQELEFQLKKLEPDEKDIKGIREWDQMTVSWLDELYDLTARFPYLQNLRITHLTAGPVPKKSGKDAAKDPYVGRITLSGVVPPEDSALVNTLIETINRDTHVRATHGRLKPPDFSLQLDIAKQPPSRYVERLVPPAAPRPAAAPPPSPDTAEEEGGGP